MTSDEGPNSQKTVFRPSPLAAQQPPGAPAAPPPPGAVASPGPRAVGAQNDDVPPLDTPMSVRNPLMAAAARLLALAAAIVAERQVVDPAGLLARASAEGKAFEKLLAGLGLSAEDNARARYAVLATVDDIVQNLPGGAQSDWARQSLVVQSFGQAFGGDQFWTILDNMLSRPAAYRDLLELYHACLAVGFQGRFRVSGDGPQQLRQRMGAIFAALSDIRARPETDLVPNWRGVAAPRRKIGWLPSALAIVGAAFAALLLLFLGLKLTLDSREQAPRLVLRTVPPIETARIDRTVADTAKPPSTQLDRIRSRLQSPCIDAEDDGSDIRLVIAACPGLPGGMFSKGASDLDPAYVPLISEAGRALSPEAGTITVVAHTDSDPISGALAATYPDNDALSAARAASVQRLLDGVVAEPSRLSYEGRGDSEPVDRRDTPEAKAKNRRVELVIPRSQ